MLVEYQVAVPDEERARLVADALVERGHRWVRVRPVYLPHLDPQHRLFGRPEFSRPELEGWWQVGSLVDEPASDRDAEFHQQECEREAVRATARAHGGFYDGGSMAGRETMLSHLDRRGLVHDLDEERAHAVRRAVIAGFPPRPQALVPSVPLRYAAEGDGHPPLLELVRQVVRRQRAQRGELPEGTAWWLTPDAGAFEDDRELLFELANAAMHQGTCYPHTAQEIPLLAALAAHDGVHPVHRAVLVTFLTEAGTIGSRLVAADADRRVALGLALEEHEDERAARSAVEAAAPELLERWDGECEAVRFALAALAAVCPEAARPSGVIPRVHALAEDSPDPHRAVAARLAARLAENAPDALPAALQEAMANAPDPDRGLPSPYAPVRGACLTVLKSMLERQMSLLMDS